MIGCIATAESNGPIICADKELQDAAWFSKEEVMNALNGRGKLLVPRSHTIAYNILRHWVNL